MNDWFRFVGSNKRLLNFGFLFNFFSSFGQTFFISLFVPFWIDSLNITNAGFGSMYAIATVASAFFLSISGRFIDRMSLRRYGLIVFFGLMASVIILSQAYNIFVLITGLFLVRWFGQGLMTHTSATGIAKYFDNNRGDALGFTTLGAPVGQFFFTILAVPLIALVGWRLSLIYMAIVAIFLVIPALWAITPVTPVVLVHNDPEVNTLKARNNYLKSYKFWIISANSFIIPFICTAVFLYQYTIGLNKGWDASWIAFSFAFFAIFNVISLLFSGSLTSRYSGVFLFPLYLIPTLIGLLLMSVTDFKWVFPIFYSLLGISSGLGSTIKTVLQVEIYGTGDLGKIRSYFSTLIVLSTALGPPVFGYFIDRQFSSNFIMLIMSIMVLLVFMMSLQIRKYNIS